MPANTKHRRRRAFFTYDAFSLSMTDIRFYGLVGLSKSYWPLSSKRRTNTRCQLCPFCTGFTHPPQKGYTFFAKQKQQGRRETWLAVPLRFSLLASGVIAQASQGDKDVLQAGQNCLYRRVGKPGFIEVAAQPCGASG